jgi:hypothetical protein
MLNYAVIVAMWLAGYAGFPWWLVLAGAGTLTLGAWWRKVLQLSREPRARWTSKATTYFVTGVVLDIALAALCFGAGRLVRWVLGWVLA